MFSLIINTPCFHKYKQIYTKLGQDSECQPLHCVPMSISHCMIVYIFPALEITKFLHSTTLSLSLGVIFVPCDNKLPVRFLLTYVYISGM